MYATSSEGVRIAYEIAGHGPPLLLHHGFGTSGQGWHGDYVPALRDDFQLILLDARGHGLSDKPHDPAAYSMADRAADVIAVLDAVGIERAHYFGYSMGCRVGFAVGALEPTRISTFILGGGHPFLRSADTNDAVIGELQQGIGRFYELWEQLAGSVSEVERQAILANDPDALIACLLADRVERGWDWGLGRMTMPCLVFAGELDAPTRDLAQQAATAMPQATFLSLQGCDHSSAAEPNDPLLSRMRSLLSSAG